MAFTFKYYDDAGLTTETGTLTFTQEADGSTGPVDKSVFLGSTTSNRKIETTSQPAVDPISVQVTDTTPGSGHETTEVKLATTAVGLDTAVAGAGVDLPATINSLAANAVEIFIRVEDATGTVGTSTELGIITVEVQETSQ